MALECIKGTTVPIVDVVKKASTIFSEKYERHGWWVMCPAFGTALTEIGIENVSFCGGIPMFIPLFCKPVAKEKFSANVDAKFWWPEEDSTKRLEYFDWLIEQYSKEI